MANNSVFHYQFSWQLFFSFFKSAWNSTFQSLLLLYHSYLIKVATTIMFLLRSLKPSAFYYHKNALNVASLHSLSPINSYLQCYFNPLLIATYTVPENRWETLIISENLISLTTYRITEKSPLRISLKKKTIILLLTVTVISTTDATPQMMSEIHHTSTQGMKK